MSEQDYENWFKPVLRGLEALIKESRRHLETAHLGIDLLEAETFRSTLKMLDGTIKSFNEHGNPNGLRHLKEFWRLDGWVSEKLNAPENDLWLPRSEKDVSALEALLKMLGGPVVENQRSSPDQIVELLLQHPKGPEALTSLAKQLSPDDVTPLRNAFDVHPLHGLPGRLENRAEEIRAAEDAHFLAARESGSICFPWVSIWRTTEGFRRLREIDGRYGIEPSDSRVYSIKSYLDDKAAIEREQAIARERAEASGDKRYYALHAARVADCEARHFSLAHVRPSLDRAGSPAELWWLVQAAARMWGHATGQVSAHDLLRGARNALSETYAGLIRFSHDDLVPPEPYPELSHVETINKLNRIVNSLMRLEEQPDSIKAKSENSVPPIPGSIHPSNGGSPGQAFHGGEANTGSSPQSQGRTGKSAVVTAQIISGVKDVLERLGLLRVKTRASADLYNHYEKQGNAQPHHARSTYHEFRAEVGRVFVETGLIPSLLTVELLYDDDPARGLTKALEWLESVLKEAQAIDEQPSALTVQTGERNIPREVGGHKLAQIDPTSGGVPIISSELQLPELPRWDKSERKLWHGEVVCRELRRGTELEEILDRFHDAGWRTSVGGVHEADIKARIDSLNNGMSKRSTIWFYRDNTRIAWKVQQPFE